MEYKVKNVTLDIDVTNSGEFTGNCLLYIPFKHKEFLKDWCGANKYEDRDSHDPVFIHTYGYIYVNKAKMCYTTDSPDLLIAYLSWLFTEDGEHIVEVEYENPFWAIHDTFHALNDESGCTIYVDADIEYERLKEALDVFVKQGYEITSELIEEIQEAYNGRFGKNTVSFEEYLYVEDSYEEEEEEVY